MAHYVDLSIPLEESIPRWKIKFESEYNTHSYMASTISLSVHTATHLDSPLHYVAGAPGVDQFPLEMAVCQALILDLTGTGKGQAIDVNDIAARFPANYPEAVILRTDWPRKWWRTPAFWAEAPYVTRAAAAWLAGKQIRIVGYDFPQDLAIRHIASGKATAADFVVHHEILSRGIWQIEYLTNLHELGAERATLLICPLPLAGLEASPVRVLGKPAREE